LELSNLSALIADVTGTKLLSNKVVVGCPKLILVPDERTARELRRTTDHKVCALSTLASANGPTEPIAVRAENLSYIMFTSGTTGVPKGVMISAGSVHHFISVIQERYGLTREDRVVGPMELSFDLSVFNMFMTWNAGASLHLVPLAEVMASAKFIKENRIT